MSCPVASQFADEKSIDASETSASLHRANSSSSWQGHFERRLRSSGEVSQYHERSVSEMLHDDDVHRRKRKSSKKQKQKKATTFASHDSTGESTVSPADDKSVASAPNTNPDDGEDPPAATESTTSAPSQLPSAIRQPARSSLASRKQLAFADDLARSMDDDETMFVAQRAEGSEDYARKGSLSVASSESGFTVGSHDSGGSASDLTGSLGSDVAHLRLVQRVLDRAYGHEIDMTDADHMDEAQVRKVLESERLRLRFLEAMAAGTSTGTIVIETYGNTIVMANTAAQRMFGVVWDDLAGNNINMLMDDVIAKGHDALIRNYTDRWRKAQSQPASRVVDPMYDRARDVHCKRYMPDGTTRLFPAKLTVRAFSMIEDTPEPPRLFIAFVTETTEQVSTARELRVARSVRSMATSAVILMDMWGKLIDVNPACERMFGYSREYLVCDDKHGVDAKNVRIFMPQEVGAAHDGHLRYFRRRLAAEGLDGLKSPVVGSERKLTGRRMLDKAPEVEFEEFGITLRVDVVPAAQERDVVLVAYIKETESRVKLDSEIAKALFPPFLARRFVATGESIDDYAEELPDVAVLLVDVSGYTRKTQEMNNVEVIRTLKRLYERFELLASRYMGVVVDKEGDSNLIAFIEGRKKNWRVVRAVCCALEMLRWARSDECDVSIGIDFGDVGSAVYGSRHMRTWKISGFPVCLAARVESATPAGSVQITSSAFAHLHSMPGIMALFTQTTRHGLKGVDASMPTYRVDGDSIDWDALGPVFKEVIGVVEADAVKIAALEERRYKVTRGGETQLKPEPASFT